MTPAVRYPDLRSRRAALTDDAVLTGCFGLLSASLLPADLRASIQTVDLQTWAGMGLALGTVISWPGPSRHQTARILFSAVLITVPALTAPLNLGTLTHWNALDNVLLSAHQTTGLCGAALLGLGVWGKKLLGAGQWRKQRALHRLGRALPGWKLSRRLGSGAWNRVITAPDGSTLTTVHVASGDERGQDVRHVTWPEPTEGQLSKRIWPGESVLWVTLPSRRGAVIYHQQHWRGGVTWPATATEIAELLWERSGVVAALTPEETPIPVRAAPRWLTGAWNRPRRKRALTPSEIRAAGAQVWKDIPGLFNLPGGLQCNPQASFELEGGVFGLSRPGAGRITVGVWPHPDLPSVQHVDQRAVYGLEALHRADGARTVIWAPLLPLTESAPAHWTVGGVAALHRVLEVVWDQGTAAQAEPQAQGEPTDGPQWTGAGDPYQVLGVPRSASADEIRRAWRLLVLDWHPDRTQRLKPSERKAAEAHFRSINAAYQSLKQSHPQGA